MQAALLKTLKDSNLATTSTASLLRLDALDITNEQGESSTILKSYKHAWKGASAELALRTTGMYEAAINITWLDALWSGSLVDDPSEADRGWGITQSLVEAFFSKDGMTLDSGNGNLKRRMWPIVIIATVDNIAHAKGDTFDVAALRPVSGLPLVWAWYIGMFKALLDNDNDLVLELWQAGLTASARAHLCPPGDDAKKANVLLDIMHHSEVAGVHKDLLAETFPNFANTITVLKSTNLSNCSNQKLVDEMQAMGVRFNGVAFNKGMLTAVNCWETDFSDDAKAPNIFFCNT